MAKKRKSASQSGNGMRAHKNQQRFDLSIYPMFYMGQILHKNAENMATALSGHGLRNSEWRILAALQYHGEMSVGELSALTTLERSFVGRLVGKLDRESSAEFLTAAARCYRALGQTDEAAKRLRRVIDEFGETSQAVIARVRLGELGQSAP